MRGDISATLSLCDLEQDKNNLIKIHNLLAKADVGFAQSVKSGLVVSWNLELVEGEIITRRFKKFLPMIARNRQFDKSLYQYQIEGIKWLRENPRCILADDMGLGKTLQVLKACEFELFENKKDCIFIFCPNALVSNWMREIKKWLPMSEAQHYISGGLSTGINSANFIITPYSQMQNFLREHKLLNMELDTIAVFDEAHKLRNENANISKIATKFNSSTKWLLTGTPLERDEKDIEIILKILEPGFSIGRLKNDKFLMKSRFTKLTLRRTKDIALKDLPPVSHKIHYVEMNDAQHSEYQDLLKEYKERPAKEKIGVLNTLMITASHQSNGYSSKMMAALSVLSEIKLKREKTIVFSKFNSVLDRFSKLLSDENLQHVLVYGKLSKEDRDRLIYKFQNDCYCNILLINLSIGSEGLTLTEANNVLFLNEAWNPSMNRQAEDRVNRIGQHRDVNVHIFRTLNSIDINLESILQKKMKLEDEYIDLLIKEVFQ